MLPSVIDISREYAPVNQVQEDFHQSQARHRLLIGGYGGGKTYPTIWDVFKHCFDNPGHEFAVFRNTWDELEENVQQDMVELALEKGFADKKGWNKTEHNLILVNKLKIMFRPLTMGRDRIKGMHLCGFFVDDPDEDRFKDTLSFLFSRLRNKRVQAKSFKSYWTANYEGRNWLWQTFMRDKEQGECDISLDENGSERDPYAYWICPTQGNPTLSSNYISDLAHHHSEAWMKKYVYMQDLEAWSGLVYPDFNIAVHHKDMQDIRDGAGDEMLRILVVDNGFHTTHVLKMATDFKNIYVYDEWVGHAKKTSQLGEYLQEETGKHDYRCVLIDPASGRKEQSSGLSMRDILRRDYNIVTKIADNSVKIGIHTVQDMIMPASRTPHMFFDTQFTPVVTRQMQDYKWKDNSGGGGDVNESKEDVVKVDDHGCDCARYGAMEFRRYITGSDEVRSAEEYRNMEFSAKAARLPAYRHNPRMIDYVERRRAAGRQTYRRTA